MFELVSDHDEKMITAIRFELAILALLVFILQGCQIHHKGPIHPLPPFSIAEVGDVLLVQTSADLYQWEVLVKSDGSIDLPLHRSITVAGRVPSEIAKLIEESYTPSVIPRLRVAVRLVKGGTRQ